MLNRTRGTAKKRRTLSSHPTTSAFKKKWWEVEEVGRGKRPEMSGGLYEGFAKKGEAFLLTVGAFCLQLSCFAYSPLRPLLDAL